MLKGIGWLWEHDGYDWELLVEYNKGITYIWLTRGDLYAAKMLVSASKPKGMNLCCRRFEPWPEDVERRFNKVVKDAIADVATKAVR